MRTLLKVTRPAEVYRKLSGIAQSLTPGERMPSFKTVMRDSGVGLGVVDLAYERLLEQGVVESRPRSGMYVANPYAHVNLVVARTGARI